jgi:hypothetical protein
MLRAAKLVARSSACRRSCSKVASTHGSTTSRTSVAPFGESFVWSFGFTFLSECNIGSVAPPSGPWIKKRAAASRFSSAFRDGELRLRQRPQTTGFPAGFV